MDTERPKLPKEYVLTVVLSTSLTMMCSIVYAVLSTLAVFSHLHCFGTTYYLVNGAQYYMNLFTRAYIHDITCPYSASRPELLKPHSVFVFAIIIFFFALLSMAAATALTIVAFKKSLFYQINFYAYMYVAVCSAALVVDLTLGILFGIDYGQLKNDLAQNAPGILKNYDIDLIRFGALTMMGIALKGFVLPLINIVLMVLIMVFSVDYKKKLDECEQPKQDIEIIDAYQRPKPQYEDGNWDIQNNELYPRQPKTITTQYEDGNWDIQNNELYARPHQNRRRHVEDEPHRHSFHGRDVPQIPKLPHRDAIRSEVWLNAQPGTSAMGSRPFSYLEEQRAPLPSTSSGNHRSNSSRRRDWSHVPSGPSVPDPDYSPQPRRLKSALKTGYP